MEKKPISPLLAGFFIAIALIIFSAIMTFSGGATRSPGSGWITYLIIILGLVLFISQYGKAINYHASFADYFSYGFKATTMIVLLFVIFLVIIAMTFPDMKAEAIEATRLEIEKQKNLTENERNAMVEMTSNYFWVILVGTTVLFFVIIGSIGSLIGAGITKKQPKNPFEQTHT